MNSILTSVKKLLGIAEECTDFDADVVMYVNSALFVLSQIGVGPVGFTITGSEETWEQFSPDKAKNEAVKAYLGVKVRLLGFDPPQSSSTMEAMKNAVAEMEWRLKEEFDEPLGAGATAAERIKEAVGLHVEDGRMQVEHIDEATGETVSDALATEKTGKGISEQLGKILEKLNGYRSKRPSRKHGMWQYTSKGSVPGVSGVVDLNHAYKDYPGIIKRAGLTQMKEA